MRIKIDKNSQLWINIDILYLKYNNINNKKVKHDEILRNQRFKKWSKRFYIKFYSFLFKKNEIELKECFLKSISETSFNLTSAISDDLIILRILKKIKNAKNFGEVILDDYESRKILEAYKNLTIKKK